MKRVALVVCLSVLCCFGQQNTSGSIEGTVTSGGRPLRNADVIAVNEDHPGTRPGALTDAEGHYRLENLVAGHYRIFVRRNGFSPQSYGSKSKSLRGTPQELTGGQKLQGIDFDLEPAAVITGRVTDPDGEPVIGINVHLFTPVTYKRHLKLNPGLQSVTNDLGEYRFGNLPPGRYYLITHKAEHVLPQIVNQAKPVEWIYLPTYYPGVTTLDQAAAVETHRGDELRADIMLVESKTVHVRGSVRSSIAGTTDMTVSLVPLSADLRNAGMDSFSDSSEKAGTFDINGVPPGDYWLQGSGQAGSRALLTRDRLHVGETEIAGLSLTLAPQLSFSGIYRCECVANTEGHTLGLRPDDPDSPAQPRTIKIEQNGHFTIEDVEPETYRLISFDATDDHRYTNYYLKSATLNGTDVLEHGINFATAPRGATLQIVESPDGATVTGTVSDGHSPSPAVAVVVTPEGSKLDQIHRYVYGTTDQNGKYVLRGIPPGKYTVYAWDATVSEHYGPSTVPLDPEFLKKYDGRGKEVDLKEKSSSEVNLEPQSYVE